LHFEIFPKNKSSPARAWDELRRRTLPGRLSGDSATDPKKTRPVPPGSCRRGADSSCRLIQKRQFTLTIRFTELGLAEPLLRAVAAEGYETPTPIQAQSIPHLLEGRDLLGIAQTGTGKTAAFALPMLQRLNADRRRAGPRMARSLILTPTRELAIQIAESFRAYGRHFGLRQAVIFGGVGQKPQVDAMARGVDILVATPGRLLDLMGQGHIRLEALEIFVLDEADRMLDMGFIHDVRRVIANLPPKRQTLFFSATMPEDITRLSKQLLTDPVRVEVTPVATTAEKIDQRLYYVEKAEKRELLAHVLKDPAITRTIVFTRTKHGANRVAEQLDKVGVRAAAIHGNKSQSARQKALEDFRAGRIRVLVATDIAARGIDIDGISHVINYELPNVAEQYVHRIGRTARAGAEGTALSFCEVEERPYLRDIEKLTRQKIAVVEDHPFRSAVPMGAARPQGARPDAPKPQQNQQRRWRGQRRRAA
jgi:ATP-dependent RNA helicase RhlE